MWLRGLSSVRECAEFTQPVMSPNSSSTAYESFIAAHTNAIGTVESSIRSLTWFLPWFRFKEADLASESLTSLLNLTSLYHDVLITRKLAQSNCKSLYPALQSDHARFVQAVPRCSSRDGSSYCTPGILLLGTLRVWYIGMGHAHWRLFATYSSCLKWLFVAKVATT